MNKKTQQMNLDILSNQILLELIDFLFYFIQTKMAILIDLKLKYINHQKTLLIIITSSLMEKTFMSNQLILIQNYEEIRRLHYWMFIRLWLY